MNRNTLEMIERLRNLGISLDDALALRRISMTLHRWHELECGDDHRCIVRGRRNGADFEYDDKGDAYLEYGGVSGRSRYQRIPDRETGAKRRLAAIMSRYPSLQSYIQGDPRGAALYLLRPGDMPEGCSADSYYSRGVAVYR